MSPTERFLFRLWGSAGFRLALLCAAVFAVSSAVLFAVVQVGVIGTLRAQIADAVLADLAVLRHEASAAGSDGVAEILRERDGMSAAGRAARSGLFAPDGRPIAGTLPAPPAGPGPFAMRVPDAEGEHRLFIGQAARLPDGALLVVARDGAMVEETQELLLGAFLRAAATVLLGLAGGVLVARGSLRRVDAIAATAEAIARGDLARRVPLAAEAAAAPAR